MGCLGMDCYTWQVGTADWTLEAAWAPLVDPNEAKTIRLREETMMVLGGRPSTGTFSEFKMRFTTCQHSPSPVLRW